MGGEIDGLFAADDRGCANDIRKYVDCNSEYLQKSKTIHTNGGQVSVARTGRIAAGEVPFLIMVGICA